MNYFMSTKLILPITHKERFDLSKGSDGRMYAALSNGCGTMTQAVDYAIFKKTPQERAEIATHKAKLPKTRGYKFKSLTHPQNN
jgi:uncharacterized protein YneR